jgi:hypothetical protein
MASVALVLSILVPDVGNWWYGLTLLSPLSAVYYFQRGERAEEVGLEGGRVEGGGRAASGSGRPAAASQAAASSPATSSPADRARPLSLLPPPQN